MKNVVKTLCVKFERKEKKKKKKKTIKRNFIYWENKKTKF